MINNSKILIVHTLDDSTEFLSVFKEAFEEYYFAIKLNLKCKTTKNNIISSYKEDYFFDRKIREDRVLDDLDRLFQN